MKQNLQSAFEISIEVETKIIKFKFRIKRK